MVGQLSGQILQPVDGIFVLIDLGVALLRRVELALLNHAEYFRVATFIDIQIFTHGANSCLVIRRELKFVKFAEDLAKLLPLPIPLGGVLVSDLRLLDVQEGILFEPAQLERGGFGACRKRHNLRIALQDLQGFARDGLESPIAAKTHGDEEQHNQAKTDR